MSAQPSPTSAMVGAVLPALRRHIAMMSPHRRDREGGRLLLAAEAEITRLQAASEAAPVAPIQRAPELFAALVALVEAENASIDQFTAKEIAGIEAAMKRAREALALAAPTGGSKSD